MMSKDKVNSIKLNFGFGLLSQLITISLGITIPRLILVSYGSDTNGLITTASQIFTYVALLESGIGNAAINALYKPLNKNDRHEVSEIVSSTQKYYRKVTYVYVLCILFISIILPIFIRTSLDYLTVAFVILLQGLPGAIGFYFSASYKQLMIADGKNYIVANSSLFIYVLSSIVKIYLIYLGYNIIVLQLLNLLISLIHVLLITLYIKNRYFWLELPKNPQSSLLNQRSAFAIHEISGTVFSSTDAFVLSLFLNLKVVSIYSIYNMVFLSLSSLVSSLNNGLIYILGHTFIQDKKKYVSLHDSYDSLYIALVFSLFSVAYVLIIPFITLYTNGVFDVNYIDKYLPILFVTIQLLSSCRAVSSRLISIAGHARNTQWRSVIEASINLSTSIILVNYVGIYGVLIGTIIALLYRTNDIIIYANNVILQRSPWLTYKKIVVNILIFIGIILLEENFRNQILLFCNNYINFIISGFIFTFFSFTIYIGIALVNNSELRIYIKKLIKEY